MVNLHDSAKAGGNALPQQIARFHEALLIQCYSDEGLDAAKLAQQNGSGLVVTARRGNFRSGEALSQVYRVGRHLQQTGFDQAMLLDAARYAGANRVDARTPFNDTWIGYQRELGLPVLTDSGYIGDGDRAGLQDILSRASGLGDAIALLPLHLSWLRSAKARDTLVSCVDEVGVPVAIILEYPADPLGLKHVVPSLLRLINCSVPVMLLRCDVSALGALCLGAFAAAVGTSTSLRHLYPQQSGGGGGGQDPQIAAIVKECLSFISVDKIALAAQADPDDVLWQCDCDACRTRPLSMLAIHPWPEQERLAFRHSLEVLLDLRKSLLSPGSTRASRTESWRARCQNAQFRHYDVESSTDKWEPPTFLGRWLEALEPATLKERVR
ncbi:hypothetical protein ACQEVC_33980 [Plantactinospora sp. CA-294935]|uniref:hypothetical protein n=1 Tax=Plantactinospora sp. CA-294935 TaxID=3240012 RepID=UPI003D94FE26